MRTILGILAFSVTLMASDFKSVVCSLDNTGAKIEVIIKKDAFPEFAEKDGYEIFFHTGKNATLSKYFQDIGFAKDGRNKIVKKDFLPLSNSGFKQDTEHIFSLHTSSVIPRFSVFDEEGHLLDRVGHVTLYMHFEEKEDKVRIYILEPEVDEPEFLIDKTQCRAL